MFPFERLVVYKMAVQFGDMSAGLEEKIGRHSPSLAKQLRRASESIELNIAEGAQATKPGKKANYYRIARDSVGECASIIRRACRRGYITVAERIEAERILNPLSFLLLRLIRRWEGEA